MSSWTDRVQPYQASEYITTAGSQNKVSRKAVVLGSSNIILGGKCIIQGQAIIRGDLKRLVPAPTPEQQAKMTAMQLAQYQKGGVVIQAGRYCTFGEGCVIRPPYKTYRGTFSYYPMKIGDHVLIGPASVVQAAQINDNVDIGKNCVIGRFTVIKDCARILDGTVIPPGTTVPSLTIWGGSPGQQVGELPETFPETHFDRTKTFYRNFQQSK